MRLAHLDDEGALYLPRHAHRPAGPVRHHQSPQRERAQRQAAVVGQHHRLCAAEPDVGPRHLRVLGQRQGPAGRAGPLQGGRPDGQHQGNHVLLRHEAPRDRPRRPPHAAEDRRERRAPQQVGDAPGRPRAEVRRLGGGRPGHGRLRPIRAVHMGRHVPEVHDLEGHDPTCLQLQLLLPRAPVQSEAEAAVVPPDCPQVRAGEQGLCQHTGLGRRRHVRRVIGGHRPASERFAQQQVPGHADAARSGAEGRRGQRGRGGSDPGGQAVVRRGARCAGLRREQDRARRVRHPEPEDAADILRGVLLP
mmetsp:Transcript_88135/g.269691  ORF Transcript_88135/g.269691 Transcript_88135/m.269691 type:complete len:305 (+) Transcript_88135:920-1834(+)